MNSEARNLPNGIKNLNSVEVPHSSHRIKIDTSIRTVRKSEILNSVCSHTGIVMDITIPNIPGIVLEYTSPLASYKNVRGIILQGESYLRKLEMQLLAGLWLTAYKHYDLLEADKHGNSSIHNALLRTASKDVLIDALLLSEHINNKNNKRMPQFSLAYEVHKDSANISGALQEYARTVRSIIFPTTEESIKKQKELRECEEATITSYVVQSTSRSKAHKVTSAAEIAEDKLKEARKSAKFYLAQIEEDCQLAPVFISYLKTAIAKDNLVAMGMDVRNKIVNKLRTYTYSNILELAKIIENCKPSHVEELFGDVEESLQDNSKQAEEAVTATTRKRSLAEILAEKKALAAASKETIKQ